MLKTDEVDQLAGQAATAVLTVPRLSRVFSTGTTDADGHDAINVTVVLPTEALDSMTGDLAVDTIVRIHGDLRAAGENRHAIVNFTTEDELASDGDPQS